MGSGWNFTELERLEIWLMKAMTLYGKDVSHGIRLSVRSVDGHYFLVLVVGRDMPKGEANQVLIPESARLGWEPKRWDEPMVIYESRKGYRSEIRPMREVDFRKTGKGGRWIALANLGAPHLLEMEGRDQDLLVHVRHRPGSKKYRYNYLFFGKMECMASGYTAGFREYLLRLEPVTEIRAMSGKDNFGFDVRWLWDGKTLKSVLADFAQKYSNPFSVRLPEELLTVVSADPGAKEWPVTGTAREYLQEAARAQQEANAALAEYMGCKVEATVESPKN